MYIGNFEIGRKEISIALVILFALVAMFFLGYQYAYTKAIVYANEQIEEQVNDFKAQYNIGTNPDFTLGNIPPIDLGGKNEE